MIIKNKIQIDFFFKEYMETVPNGSNILDTKDNTVLFFL